MKVTVFDRIMGSGKTTSIINLLKEHKELKFIFVTPYKDEIKRVLEELEAETPTSNKKGKELIELLKQKKNVVITHELFKRIKYDEIKSLNLRNYSLIIDEQIDLFKLLDISQTDVKMLEASKTIKFVDDRVEIDNKEFFREDSSHYKILNKINAGNVYHNNSILYELYDISILKKFKEIFIMTYLFEGQLLHAYFKLYNINVKIRKFENEDRPKKERLRELIEVYQDKPKTKNNLNSNYLINKDSKTELKTILSSSSIDRLNEKQIKQLRNNLNNFFDKSYKILDQETKSKFNKVDCIMWTTKKSFKESIQDKGYINSFIELNSKATNKYRDKSIVAYVYNRFLNPLETNFFKSKDIDIDQDQYALSELVQWIWRSRIRNYQKIYLYIPSKRMRDLFLDWLCS